MIKRTDSLTRPKCPEVCSVYSSEIRNRLRNDGCFVPAVLEGQAKSPSSKLDSLWLPIGYHPWWCKVLKRAIGRFNKDDSVGFLLEMGTSLTRPVVKIAWKNMLPRTDFLLRPNGWRMG